MTDDSIRIERFGKQLALVAPFSARDDARAFPDRRYWKPGYGEGGAWIFAPSAGNVQHALESFPEADWSTAAGRVRDEVVEQRQTAEVMRAARDGVLRAPDFKFNTEFPPFEHQETVFALSRAHAEFALFMEMGTGKTRIIIDNAVYLHQMGSIEAVLVVAPNSVKETWVEEIERMAPEWSSHRVAVWSAHAKKRQRQEVDELIHGDADGALRWLIVNVEGLSTDRLYEVAMEYVQRHRAMVVVDESSRIKNPKAKRTKAAFKLGQAAAYRRIMSGTPVTQGLLDLYAQFRFLNPLILGFSSYYAFRNRYAIMGGFNQKQVVGYSNLDELTDTIEPYSYRVTREECIDLPPKIFETRTVELTKDQRRVYDEMKRNMLTEVEGQTVTATIVLTQLLRLQQIVGGFVAVKGRDDLTMLETHEVRGIPGKNAKLEALLELVDDLPEDEHVIIWARFRAEIALIADALRERYGDESVGEFHGGTPQRERDHVRRSFQRLADPLRFFIGQTETGGLGITLTAAGTVVYFSNSFSLESRLQSEDRAHRIGQEKTVTYVDIVAKSTLDRKVLQALRAKKNLANMITGDEWRSWI